ncbi:MAG: carbohydrate ABC transporter permease [Paenibacillaceae bacterium]|nr:carbohydrate ABC transporter permease [Paenibacillaceae bacterium]
MGRVLVGAFVLASLLFTLIPIVLALLGSFKTNTELTVGATFLPSRWEFSTYARAWNEAHFAIFTWNSIYVSVLSSIGTVAVASMAAYAVDRVAFAGKRLFVAVQTGTMFVALGAITLRPQFDIMVGLHLNTSLAAVIILNISNHAFAFLILLGFMKGIPRDLDEAGRIDGAGFGTIYATIVMPLLLPGIGIVSLFAFRDAWNEYVMPLVFTLSQPRLQVLTVGLANLKYSPEGALQNNLMLAGACLSMVPMIVMFLLANKSFLQVNAGGLKG